MRESHLAACWTEINSHKRIEINLFFPYSEYVKTVLHMEFLLKELDGSSALVRRNCFDEKDKISSGFIWFVFLTSVFKNSFPLSEKKGTQLFQQLMLFLLPSKSLCLFLQTCGPV